MTKFNSRSERRAYERKIVKARKKKTLTALAMAGTVTVTQFAGVGAAAADDGMRIASEQSTRSTVPVLESITVEDGVLYVTALSDKGEATYSMTFEAEKDHSGYDILKKVFDDARSAYENLLAVENELAPEFEAWSDVRYTFNSDGTNAVAHLKTGEKRSFANIDEARAYQNRISMEYRQHSIEMSAARNTYATAQNNLDNFQPSASETDYLLTIQAPAGFTSYYEDADGNPLTSDTFHIPGASVVVPVNYDGFLVMNIFFDEPTDIRDARIFTNLKPAEETPEAPEVITDTVLPEKAVSVSMPLFGKPATIDLVTGIEFADGAEFKSLSLSSNTEEGYEDFRDRIATLDLDYTISGSDITVEAGEWFTEPETRTMKYRITDTMDKTYTGVVTFTVSPAGSITGLAPVIYDSSDSRTAYKDATRSLGVYLGAANENKNVFNYSNGQLINADSAYATRDAAFGYQGERIAVRPTANDISTARTTDNIFGDAYDPNTLEKVFAYETLQVKDPVTGLWTSTSYEGKNGRVSVLPAEGTDTEVLGDRNQYAEAVVAFDPRDLSALVSEQTEYRIGTVAYGENVDDVEAFWANAGEGDYVSSTVTFGIKERDISFTSANPYCFTPDNLPDSLTNREHGAWLVQGDYRAHAGGSTGTSFDRTCAPEGVVDEAETSAGETTVIDVLANDKHVSTIDGIEVEETNYVWDASTLRIVDGEGNPVMKLETENGLWEVIDGKLSFTAKEGITGTKLEEVTYTVKQIWVGDPDADYGPFISSMTKREGGSISGIATTVLINGVTPETPVEEVPEVPEEVIPEVPEEIVPEPEVPAEEVPEVPEEVTPETPVEEVPEEVTPEVPVEVIPEAEVPASTATSGETPTYSGAEISPAEFLALFALGGGGLVALTARQMRLKKAEN